MKRILLPVNPKSRSGSDACEQLESALKSTQHRLIELSSEEKKQDFNDLIRKYHQQVDLVIIGGGDGSVNYVLLALVETQLPLLVCPLGTANLLAKSLNLTARIDDVISLIEKGKVIQVDLGEVNGIYFINVTGLGVSTEVNQQLPTELKKKAGRMSFWLWGMEQIRNMQPFRASITVNGDKTIHTRTWQITVCNGRHYANWMTIEKDASYADQKLHCLSTEVKKWWQGAFLLPSYLRGKYRESQDVTIVEGQEIRIETRHRHCIDVDGDVKTTTPAVFKVRPNALKMLVPEIDQPALAT